MADPPSRRPTSRLLVAAALYNAAWGLAAMFAPSRLTRFLGFEPEGASIGWRAAGVMILAYAPAYLWAAANRRAARPVLITALFGKSIGGLGWLAGVATGRFRRRTVLLPLFNDAIWLPGLWALVRRAGSRSIPPSPQRGR